MKTHPSALQTLLALLLLFRMDAQGAVVFSDTFTPGDGTGTAGGAIHGTAVETGTGIWQGHQFYEYTSGGTVVWDVTNSNSIHTRVGHVAVNNGSTISGSISSISATIRNPFANLESPLVWTGIGYVSSPLSEFDSSLFTLNTEQLYMLLRNNGDYQVLARTGGILTSGTASVFNDGVGDSGFNDLRLDYNQAANTLSASINAVNVLNNFNLTSVGYTTSSSITAVGFQLFRHEGAEVDSFAFESSAVPEPSRALLAALGLFSLMLRRRR